MGKRALRGTHLCLLLGDLLLREKVHGAIGRAVVPPWGRCALHVLSQLLPEVLAEEQVQACSAFWVVPSACTMAFANKGCLQFRLQSSPLLRLLPPLSSFPPLPLPLSSSTQTQTSGGVLAWCRIWPKGDAHDNSLLDKQVKQQ